jgi:hypothetical protein
LLFGSFEPPQKVPVLANNLMIVAAGADQTLLAPINKPPDKPAPIIGKGGTKPPRLTTSPTATLRGDSRINTENRAYSARKFTQTMVSFGPVHRHN